MSRLLLPAFLAAFSLPATAKEAGNGLTFGGEVKLEYLNANSDLWAFDGDVSLSWRSGGLLGVDASIETTYFDDGSDFTNVWGALILSTGAGEFAVGAPRPIVDSLDPMPRFSSSRVLDLQTSFLRGPITSLASASDNGVTPGITWKQETGSLTFGAGYHHLNGGNNTDILEGAMRYEAGATTFFITGEFAETEGPNTTLLQIGAFHDADRFDLGAAFSQLDTSDTTHSLRLYGGFDVTSAVTLRGDALLVQDANDIYSLSATYSMDSGLFVEGGGSKVTGGGTEIYDIGVGFKF